MTKDTTADVQLPDDKPPAWANSWMKWALRTPVIQSMVGQGVALLSFNGRKTGKPFTIPVSYHREGDIVTLTTKRQRRWWHNFESPLEVELRLAGRDYVGKAKIETDDAEALEFMTEYLQKHPIDAKAYGLTRDEISEERVAEIIPHIVIIRTEVSP